MPRIGILGGSFNPPHNGHIEMLTWALIEKGLDFVAFMPTKKNPEKLESEATVTSADDMQRLEMLKLITKHNDNFSIITDELNDREVSYTYNTMKRLREDYIGCEIFFIIGTDALFGIEGWHRGAELLRENKFIVGKRPHDSLDRINEKIDELSRKYGTEILLINQDMPELSSTSIREKIKNGEDITDLVPQRVMQYIKDEGLYKND